MPGRNVEEEIRSFRIRQKYNPTDSEKVEDNLRITKVRRIIDWPPQRFRFNVKNG